MSPARTATRSALRSAAARRTAAATALLLALTACGQDSSGGGDAEDPAAREGGGTIGIAMPTKSSERWIADGENMVEQFEEAGYETDLQYGEDRVERQVSQIENMISQGHDLLVVAAIDGASLTNVLQRADGAGVPVVAYDRLLMGTEHVDCYATFDNTRVGELQGQYIVDALGLEEAGEDEQFTLELFAGSPDDNNTRYFFEGAMSVLRPHLDAGTLVVRSGQTEMSEVTTLRWDGATAQRRMDDLLTAHYGGGRRLDAVLSPYDGISIGVISSLKSVGYGSDGLPFPVVTGQDAELASVKSIIAGEQTQTVFKDTRELARQAVSMSDALLSGEEPEVNDTESYDNGEKTVPSYLLEPVSIDAENYGLLVEESYYTEAQLS